MLGGTAAVAMLGGLSLAFGSAGAAAQPAPPAPPAPPSSAAPHDGAERHEERIIVRTYRHEEHRDHQDGSARTERHGSGDSEHREEHRIVSVITTAGGDGPPDGGTIDLEGPDGRRIVMPRRCAGQQGRVDVSEGEANNRTRVILCSAGDGERTPAQQAEALRRARARLAEDNQIPAEHRQRVLAAIDREIARLGGAR
jgi:hypothetical protein